MRRLQLCFLVTTALLSLILLTSCARRRIQVSDTRIALGTYVQISIVAEREDSEKAREVLERSFGQIADYDRLFDYRKEGGALFRFNGETVLRKSDNELLFSLIKNSIEIARLTEGNFDPTILPIVKLWGFDSDRPALPPEDEIQKALKQVGYQKIRVLEDRIVKPGEVQLDLSAIAKGKIVDLVSDLIAQAGYRDYLVNAGGDIHTSGKNVQRKKWRIAIQHPTRQDMYSGIVENENGAIVTSGDYERFFVHEGVRYSHLFDPKTGYPSNDVKSVTIRAEKNMYADAIATAVFVMGRTKGYAFLLEQRIEGFIMFEGKNNKIESLATPGFWK